MFDTATYKRRRDELKKLVKEGIIILFGNNESPANFPNNGYFPFRQDSSFLYYYGLQRDGLVGVIDIDNDKDLLIGNDIDIEDIVWYGSVESMEEMRQRCGASETLPMRSLIRGQKFFSGKTVFMKNFWVFALKSHPFLSSRQIR